MNHSQITINREKEAMPRVKVGSRRQITIPADTAKRLGLTAGEELELVERDKVIMLVPRKHIPKDQAWFWTNEWQNMIREAEADVAAGRVKGPFESVDELIKELNTWGSPALIRSKETSKMCQRISSGEQKKRSAF